MFNCQAASPFAHVRIVRITTCNGRFGAHISAQLCHRPHARLHADDTDSLQIPGPPHPRGCPRRFQQWHPRTSPPLQSCRPAIMTRMSVRLCLYWICKRDASASTAGSLVNVAVFKPCFWSSRLTSAILMAPANLFAPASSLTAICTSTSTLFAARRLVSCIFGAQV